MSRTFIVLAALLRALLQAVSAALSPPCCAACDARLPRHAVFCGTCAATVEPFRGTGPEGTVPLIAFAAYGGAVAVALRRFKYGDRPDLARGLGHLARRAARSAHLEADLVVPVPLHAQRLAERGYNQAALLAVQVAAEIGAPVALRALSRIRATDPQARLDRAHRFVNVEGAFRAPVPGRVRGRRVVLVDDVATTGATLAAGAAALLAAGALHVTTLVVARAE